MDNPSFKKEIFAQRLTELLETSSETTYSLSDKLSLSPATISRYANGHMTPKTLTIHAIANVFGVNPLWLMGEHPNKYLTTLSDTSGKKTADISAAELAVVAAYRIASSDDRAIIDNIVSRYTHPAPVKTVQAAAFGKGPLPTSPGTTADARSIVEDTSENLQGT